MACNIIRPPRIAKKQKSGNGLKRKCSDRQLLGAQLPECSLPCKQRNRWFALRHPHCQRGLWLTEMSKDTPILSVGIMCGTTSTKYVNVKASTGRKTEQMKILRFFSCPQLKNFWFYRLCFMQVFDISDPGTLVRAVIFGALIPYGVYEVCFLPCCCCCCWSICSFSLFFIAEHSVTVWCAAHNCGGPQSQRRLVHWYSGQAGWMIYAPK